MQLSKFIRYLGTVKIAHVGGRGAGTIGRLFIVQDLEIVVLKVGVVLRLVFSRYSTPLFHVIFKGSLKILVDFQQNQM